MNFYDIENKQNNNKTASSGSFRPRKSIFSTTKTKSEIEQPKVLINGYSLNDSRQNKMYTAPNFYSPLNSVPPPAHIIIGGRKIDSMNRTASPFYARKNPMSRVIIQNSNQPQCIRPSSAACRSPVVVNPTRLIQNSVSGMSNSRVVPIQFYTSSKPIASQTSNIMLSPSHLKKRSIMAQGKTYQRGNVRQNSPVKFIAREMVRQHSPITREIITEPTRIVVRDQPVRIVIRDDPQTISEINKLASLNQFLNQQFTIVNTQLNYFKDKTCQKQVVNDEIFLERSLNKIDDIFLRQTNQALYKLQQISRNSSTNGFSRKSISRERRRNSPPTFNKVFNNSWEMSGISNSIKNTQQLSNSSNFTGCNHLNPN